MSDNFSRGRATGRGWGDCVIDGTGPVAYRCFHNGQSEYKIKPEHASRTFFEHLLRENIRANFLSSILTYSKPAIILDIKTARALVEDVMGRGLYIRNEWNLVDVNDTLIVQITHVSDEWVKFTFHGFTDLFQTVRQDNGKYTLVSRYAE
jgi:hypothetical protein